MRKDFLSKICAYVAFALSIIILILWCCNVGGFEVVNLDSFVAVIVSLLAIIVTIVLGWQIYNTIELKEKIKDLDLLKQKLDEQQIKMDMLNHKSRHMTGLTWGKSSLEKGQYAAAFYYYIFALRSSLSLTNPVNVDNIRSEMKRAADKINKGDYLVEHQYDDVINEDKELKVLPNYTFIKDWYEPLFKAFVDKVNV